MAEDIACNLMSKRNTAVAADVTLSNNYLMTVIAGVMVLLMASTNDAL
jgi:hypothetical protein